MSRSTPNDRRAAQEGLTARRRATLVAGVVALAACAHPPHEASRPEDALAGYRAALAARDVAALAAATSSVSPGYLDAQALERELALDPQALDEARRRLGREIVGVQTISRVVFAGGATVVLVREADGVWRVAEGGLAPAAQDTPPRALATFFRAVDAKALTVVRRLIPTARAAQYAEDARLLAHLDAEAERITRARSSIDAGATVTISGERAELSWGDGRRVTFVREEGAWKIVDLE